MSMPSPAGAGGEVESGPSVVMVIVDVLCFAAALTFAILLYLEFKATL
jgi:hypothetical protein|tara:strand:- start:293 stop:436 length:144 start_codon:yes stop_codon:yes gene_type:complete